VFKREDTGARHRLKELDVEVKPNAEEKSLTEDPLYTFIFTEVDTLGGELESKIKIHVVSGTNAAQAVRRVLSSLKGKCNPSSLRVLYWTRTTTHRKPECIAAINLSELLLK
jgi:hypothetical protein